MTSSISNGGQNISRRIAAIVRFKKYPQGMALVSVCIVFVLASLTVFGRTETYGTEAFTPKKRSELETAMAMTRINRCTTIAGAIDTYAKALVHDNGIFLATVSSLDRQEALYKAMQKSSEDGWEVCHLRMGDELEYVDESNGYYILNLEKISEKKYTAILSFDVHYFPDPQGETIQHVMMTEDGFGQAGSVQIPIEIGMEDGWIVEEIGAREFVPRDSMSALNDMEPLKLLRAVGKTGTFEAEIRTIHYVLEENAQSLFRFWAGNNITVQPQLNAEFADAHIDYNTRYSLEGKIMEGAPETHVGTMRKYMDSAEEKVEFPKEMVAGDHSGSNSDGYEWSSEYIGDGWDGIHADGGMDTLELEDDETVKLPEFCKVQIYWEGDLVEEVLAKEVAP